MLQTGGRCSRSETFLKSCGRFIRLRVCFTILISLGSASRAHGFTSGDLNVISRDNPTQYSTGFALPTLDETLPSASLPQDQNSVDGNKALMEGQQLARQNTKESYLKAIERYEEALRLFRAAGEKEQEITALFAISSSYSSLNEKRKSLEYGEQAVKLAEGLNNPPMLAQVLLNVGAINSMQGEQRKALEYFDRVLPLVQGESDRAMRAQTLVSIGGAYIYLGERRKAVTYFEQALPVFRSLADPRGEASTLTALAALHSKLGEQKRALDLFNQALPALRKSGNLVAEGYALSGIGNIYSSFGDQQKALDYYTQALAVMKTGNSRFAEASVLNNIGFIQHELGDKQKALDYLNQSFKLSRSISGLRGGHESLNNIGSVYSSMAEYQKALNFFFQALESARADKNLAAEASILSNIGTVYISLGEPREALKYFLESLPIAQRLDDRVNAAITLGLIGEVYDSLGESRTALDYYNLGLLLGRELGDQGIQVRALTRVASSTYYLGERQKALDYNLQAIELSRKIGDREGEAVLLNNLGVIYARAREYQPALEYYTQALSVARELIFRKGEAATLANLGLLYEEQGLLEKAVGYYERAIEIQEKVRTEARLEEFKINLAEQSINTYARAVQIYMRLGQPAKAFDLSERARSRTFLDQLGNARIEILKGADEQLLQKEQALRFQLSALGQQLGKERGRAKDDLNPEAIAALEGQLLARRAEYEELLTVLRLKAPEYASIFSVSSLKLAETQKLLDKETTLVSYFVMLNNTAAFVITRGSFKAFLLPVGAKALDAEVTSFRSFADISNPYPQPLKNLYRSLISPLEQHLKTRRIGIIPHGTLHYLPFSALTNGRRYLGDDRVIFYLPSASVLPFIRQKSKPTNNNLLAIAQSRAAGLPLLKYADKSAEEVATLYNTKALTGEGASESVFRARAANSGLILIAAHGRLNTSSPLFSHIVLAPDDVNDGLLEVHEVYGLDLKNVGLVVLSGCQTQLGERSQGDDIVGLNRAFIYAGAPTVVASLWSVQDKQTGELIVSFFKQLRNGKSKAEALKEAQREMRVKYPHPYYWAAFVLTGAP
jgi:CHAT domain-containing protein